MNKKSSSARENSLLYLHAVGAYRAMLGLARTDNRFLNDAVKRNSVRLLQHAALAIDAPTEGIRARARHYAKLCIIKMEALVDAIRFESDENPFACTAATRQLELLRGFCSDVTKTIGEPSSSETAPSPLAEEEARPQSVGPLRHFDTQRYGESRPDAAEGMRIDLPSAGTS